MKFREGSRVRQALEKGPRTYRPKRCGNNNKDEDNSPKTLNDKNHQASSQKFRQQIHKEAGGHIGRNVVEITIKMKTIVRKPLMIKILTFYFDSFNIIVVAFYCNSNSFFILSSGLRIF